MICPHCHSENRDGARFCDACGTPLDEVVVSESSLFGEPQDETFSLIVEDDNQDSLPLPSVEAEEEFIAEERGLDFDGPDAETSEDGPGGDRTAVLQAVPSPATDGASASKRVSDTAGIDEILVDASYAPPRATWRSGDTMEMPRIEGEPAPKQKEFRAPDPNADKGGKGKVVAIAIAVVVLLLATAAAITYHMELWGGKTLPDVVGYTQSDAQYVLEGKGFSVRALQSKSDETEGVVLLTDPSAGARQASGTEIVIHVSVSRVVPDVTGKQRDAAAKMFDDEGLENVTVVEQRSDEAEGVVLAVSPTAGTKAKAAAPITITVAVPYTVPDVSGQTWDEASASLGEGGYLSLASYEYNENVAPGTVLRTEPGAGEKLVSGSTVTAVIALSRAAELEAAARSYLQGAGTVSIGGTTYEIASVDAVKYLGSDQTSFTITGSAVTTLDGETVRGSAKQKSATITWNSGNEIVSIA